jgi:endonuclease YncB( thermonuclease family)
MYEYNCRIVRVVDGDTVDVDIDLGFNHWIHDERIRLFGVDCPECRSRDPEEKAAGLAAKDYVKGLLHDRRDLHSHHKRKRKIRTILRRHTTY